MVKASANQPNDGHVLVSVQATDEGTPLVSCENGSRACLIYVRAWAMPYAWVSHVLLPRRCRSWKARRSSAVLPPLAPMQRR